MNPAYDDMRGSAAERVRRLEPAPRRKARGQGRGRGERGRVRRGARRPARRRQAALNPGQEGSCEPVNAARLADAGAAVGYAGSPELRRGKAQGRERSRVVTLAAFAVRLYWNLAVHNPLDQVHVRRHGRLPGAGPDEHRLPHEAAARTSRSSPGARTACRDVEARLRAASNGVAFGVVFAAMGALSVGLRLRARAPPHARRVDVAGGGRRARPLLPVGSRSADTC